MISNLMRQGVSWVLFCVFLIERMYNYSTQAIFEVQKSRFFCKLRLKIHSYCNWIVQYVYTSVQLQSSTDWSHWQALIPRETTLKTPKISRTPSYPLYIQCSTMSWKVFHHPGCFITIHESAKFIMLLIQDPV